MAPSRRASTPSPAVARSANQTAKKSDSSKKRAAWGCYFPEARVSSSTKTPVYPHQFIIELDPTVTSFEIDAGGYPTSAASSRPTAYLGGASRPFQDTNAAGSGKSKADAINVPRPGSDAYPRGNPHYSDNASESLRRWVIAPPSEDPYNNVASVKASNGKVNSADYL